MGDNEERCEWGAPISTVCDGNLLIPGAVTDSEFFHYISQKHTLLWIWVTALTLYFMCTTHC